MIFFLDFDGVLQNENVTRKRCRNSSVCRLKDHECRYLKSSRSF